MGLEMSREQWRAVESFVQQWSERVRQERARKLEECVNKFTKCPNVSLNRAMVTFCSTSSDSLQQHLDQRKQSNYPIEDWMKQLTQQLANLSNVKLAGLGALAIAVFIDIISSSPPEESTKDALRSVFAEEKASEVWDQIDECLKRYMMNIDNQEELVKDMRRIESQLSAALTKLKNSMLRDGHMTSEALKVWVNGAAFHIQMMIHLVRLGGIQTSDPVERLLSTYLSDLDRLFEKHKAAVREKCTLRINAFLSDDYFETETGEWHYVERFRWISFNEFFEAYYEKHYSSQWYKIRDYFRAVRDDLPELLGQVGHLSIQ